MRYVTGIDEHGRAIDVRDPLGARLRQITADAGPVPDRLVPALLSLPEIFGNDLPSHPRFTEAVTDALRRLYEIGARRAVEELGAG
jgi:fructuronate reductase